MRAKFINEFERGLEPKAALGIGRVTRIQKCFRKLHLSDSKYTIISEDVIFNETCFYNIVL